MNGGAKVIGVCIEKDQLAATFTASAFALIGPDACYAGIHTQPEICAPKLCVRKDVHICVQL